MLTLRARLRFGSYDAASDADPRVHEWPPHPARLFCALVASDPKDAEWRALEWLERQPPPMVHAPDLLDARSDAMHVPTNEVKASNPNLPGRVNGQRTKPRALPAATTFSLTWPSAEPGQEVFEALDGLAARVGYVGRSTASASLTFSQDALGADAHRTYEPATTAIVTDLRVPYEGYCARLREAHEVGVRAWEVSRLAGYRLATTPVLPERAPDEGPFGRLLGFRFRSPTALHLTSTVAVTSVLRKAVIQLMDGAMPAEASGHDAENRPHVAYLALPNVGSPDHLPGLERAVARRNSNADGRLLGVALAIPRQPTDLAMQLYRALVRAGGGLDHLTLGAAGSVELVGAEDGLGPIGARPSEWTGPSETWVTATPLVLDHYPKGRDPAAFVAEALVTAGFPAPAEVVAQRAPLLPGSATLSRSAVQRRAGMPIRPSIHAWARFDRPVVGPVLAGSMRYLGLGLFAPARTSPVPHAAREDAPDEMAAP